MFAIGVLMIRDGKNLGWFCAVVFFIGMIVPPLHVFSAQLKLTDKGFLMKSLLREDYLQWDEITDIAPIRIGLNQLVGFNFTSKLRKNVKGRRLSKEISGREGALPDNYGMSPLELADLVTAYKIHSEKMNGAND